MNSATFRQQLDQVLIQAFSEGTAQDFHFSTERLHGLIHLPDDAPEKSLIAFAKDYIRQVPDALQACLTIALQAGIEPQLQPVFKAAGDPLRAVMEEPSSMGLLSRAYLAHRLIEEINDRYILHFGRALTPTDTTVDNLVAYELLGAEEANYLDTQVAWVLEELLDDEIFMQDSAQAFRQQLGSPQIAGSWNRPSLSRQYGVSLQLTPDAPEEEKPRDFTLIPGRWGYRGKAL